MTLKIATMTLKFSGNFTLEQIFQEYQTQIYDAMVDSISNHLKNKHSDELTVIKITINSTEHSISLAPEKFYVALSSAILYYEGLEEYEKCQACLNIIKSLGYEKAEIPR